MGLKKKENENLQFIALDATKQKELTKKHKKSKQKKTDEFTSNKPGVVFLKHIPHGFYEPQMRNYFSQFGDVKRLRLARSKKTHRSKGYAYIEFTCEEVAKVVADTMNNYLMFQRCLKCEVVPEDKLHSKTFYGRRKYAPPTSRRDAIKAYERRSMNIKKVESRKMRSEGKRTQLKKKLEEMGIDYDMSNLKGNPDFQPPAKRKSTQANEDGKDHSGTTIRKEFEQMMEEFDFYDVEKGKKRSAQNAECPQSTDAQEGEATDSGIDHESPDEGAFGSEEEDTDRGLIVDMQGCLPELNTTPEMIVDLDDSEVTFKTPPQKIKKTSISSKGSNAVITPKSEIRPMKTKSARKRQLFEKRKLLNMTL